MSKGYSRKNSKHLRNLGNLPAPHISEEPKRRNKFEYALLTCLLFMADVPCDSSYDKRMSELLAKVKAAHKEALTDHTQAVLSDLEARLAELPERGFAIPKVGTPDHAKGTFTKLISEQEVREAIHTMKEGLR